MYKTVKINLAGMLFQTDEKAYAILRDYLQSIDNKLKNVPGGNETFIDIEARIAEIFQARKGSTGIINQEDVEAVISIIGRLEEFDHAGDSDRKISHAINRRRLYRDKSNSIIGGVCSGIGVYLNTDPVWLRILFIILIFAYALGFLFYIGLWIALPMGCVNLLKF
ncbi:MAG: PspC domain-containing protein [Bacteroidales bacterium]